MFKTKRNTNANAPKPQIIDFGYLSSPIELLFEQFRTNSKGLSQEEAENRLEEYGYNEPAKSNNENVFVQLLAKFANPLVAVLVIIGLFSLFFGEAISAVFVLLMIFLSVGLSFVQEFRSGKEAERLSEMVRVTATVYRDGKAIEIPIKEIVPGDVVYLSAGDIIPADVRIITCKDLFVNQAALTGESFPIEKFSEVPPNLSKSLTEFTNLAFMGSSVVSGTGHGLVLTTGISTKFGEVSKRLTTLRIETTFDKGLKTFTWMMIKIMSILVSFIFLISVVRHVSPIESLLFALAVAVGLTPEMLPMLVAINLSKGAIAMSRKKVIVRRLSAIQNFGAMDVLCTDKTGTLTRDEIVLEKYCDIFGKEDDDVLRFAYLNSYYQTGLKNLLDIAILKHKEIEIANWTKIDEIPFDFQRRIMSVVVEMEGTHKIIAKGAPESIFNKCTRCLVEDEILDIQPLFMPELMEEVVKLSQEGFRVIAIAYKDTDIKKQVYSKEDESDLILTGYVAFLDPPKPSTIQTLGILKDLGIRLKVLTGDNELVTKKICGDLGINTSNLIMGTQLETMSDDAIDAVVEETDVFARLSPIQKERIVMSLHRKGHTVGFMGDGINDAPALKASDVGISVNNAVDIAKESADIVLLEKSLRVLEDGVIEGRKTFGNIIKYIKMGSSSNFGNMFSMTGASILLPFLPMMPIQILLNNLLYDISQVAIPTDNVDKDYIAKPKPWDVAKIRKFMMTIGPISSIFDYATFALMWFVFNAQSVGNQSLFHSGWFIESLCSQTLVIHIIRTNKIPFFESRPSKYLVISSFIIVAIGIYIVNSPLGHYFKLIPLPLSYYGYLAGIMFLYLTSVFLIKTYIFKNLNKD